MIVRVFRGDRISFLEQPREPDPKRCAASITTYQGGGWSHSSQCKRPPVNQEPDPSTAGGPLYGWCRRRTPSLVKTRDDTADRNRRARMDAERVSWQLQALDSRIVKAAAGLYYARTYSSSEHLTETAETELFELLEQRESLNQQGTRELGDYLRWIFVHDAVTTSE